MDHIGTEERPVLLRDLPDDPRSIAETLIERLTTRVERAWQAMPKHPSVHAEHTEMTKALHELRNQVRILAEEYARITPISDLETGTVLATNLTLYPLTEDDDVEEILSNAEVAHATDTTGGLRLLVRDPL